MFQQGASQRGWKHDLAAVGDVAWRHPRLERADSLRGPGSKDRVADTHDEWVVDERRYLSEASMAKLYPDRDNDTVTAIQGSDR